MEGKCVKILLLISSEHCLNRLHSSEKRNIRRILHYDEIVVHFRRNWMDYDEKGFLHAEMFALSPDYRALCRIVEIDCTSSELRAILPKSNVNRCIVYVCFDVMPVFYQLLPANTGKN